MIGQEKRPDGKKNARDHGGKMEQRIQELWCFDIKYTGVWTILHQRRLGRHDPKWNTHQIIKIKLHRGKCYPLPTGSCMLSLVRSPTAFREIPTSIPNPWPLFKFLVWTNITCTDRDSVRTMDMSPDRVEHQPAVPSVHCLSLGSVILLCPFGPWVHIPWLKPSKLFETCFDPNEEPPGLKIDPGPRNSTRVFSPDVSYGSKFPNIISKDICIKLHHGQISQLSQHLDARNTRNHQLLRWNSISHTIIINYCCEIPYHPLPSHIDRHGWSGARSNSSC